VPCCTDRLSLMAGTHGSVDLSLVLAEQLRLTTRPGWLSHPEVAATQ